MPKQFLNGLKCEFESCGRLYGLVAQHICDADFAPLRVQYDYGKIRQNISREKIEGRAPDMWRYIEFLPIDGDEKPETSVSTGYTPLIRARNLSKSLGIEAELYIKDDRANPTHSFKDRVVEMAVAKAIEFGYTAIACASTGNLGNALAAHAARAGLNCYIFVPHDLEPEKIRGMMIFKPTLIGMKGVYDDVNRVCSEIADNFPKLAFANINLRAYYGDGSKTVGYEIAEQLGWRAPAHVVVPVAGASLINKVRKAFQEFHETGLIEESQARIYAAQAAGCSPVSNAVIENARAVTPIKRAEIKTIAKSLAIGNPADGDLALETIRETGGYASKVTDEEIIDGIKLLAETEGIWTETAGGVTVASLKKLIEQGRIPKDDGTIVLCITGDGYKTPEAVPNLHLAHVIEPTLREFRTIYGNLEQRVS